jgi:hypothetical protein
MYIFDLAQAIEVCGMEQNHSKHVVNIVNELHNMYCKILTRDYISLEDQIVKLDYMLSERYCGFDQLGQREILEFIVKRNETTGINETLNEIKQELRIIGDESFNISATLNELPNKIKDRKTKKIEENIYTDIDALGVTTEIKEMIENTRGKQEKIHCFFKTLPKKTALSIFDLKRLLIGTLRESGGNTISGSVSHLHEKGILKSIRYKPPHCPEITLYTLSD